VEFLKLARNYGVSIYYITNRREHLKEATMRNMRELGFPMIEDKYMMFRTAEAGKETRRLAVARNHHITMLIGDNLNDFAEVLKAKALKTGQELLTASALSSDEDLLCFPMPCTANGKARCTIITSPSVIQPKWQSENSGLNLSENGKRSSGKVGSWQ
jgi:5'-nucleotidase (lipoprotein e(P4) family)